jgi:hypothetical protein
MHNFRVQIDKHNLEGSKALEIASSNLIFVSNKDELLIFSNLSLTPGGEIKIPLLASESREPNEIIGMQKSRDEKFFAVVTGKNLVMSEQKQN